MSRLFKTKGIILKTMKYGEADKIVTILTEQYGKIRAIVKGVRKTKSQFGSSTEILTLIEILVYKGKNLNIVSQSEIINSFFPQCKDLKKYGLALHCAEIVDKITVAEDTNPDIYYLFKNIIHYLQACKNPLLLTESFKWHLFTFLGYQPILNHCIGCNKNIISTPYHILDIANGGIICRSCQTVTNANQVKISDYCLRLMKRILEVDLSDICNKKISSHIIDELSRITYQYMNYYFEINSSCFKFINRFNKTNFQG